MTRRIELIVNGRREVVETDPDRSLLDVLREDLGLLGTKYGCGEGMCGACTVLIDGRATRSCLTPVGAVGDGSIVTIEGLAPPGGLHPVQRAFIEMEAMQCGYCTPGMIMGAAALLQHDPSPSRDRIVREMNGHVCRCCSYPRIVRAVELAARVAREETAEGTR
ncbi:MAG: (2Fe-2S)-binding protein [Planctomycetota bacterium]|jgi:aerobic-type carbon monoxide dehydrogenase small subunit (CoxS/CutS family)